METWLKIMSMYEGKEDGAMRSSNPGVYIYIGCFGHASVRKKPGI